MNFDHFFPATENRVVIAGLVGAGQFGASLINQAQHMPRLEVPFLCDLDLELAKKAFLDAGIDEGDIVTADSVPSALRAFEAGKKSLLMIIACFVKCQPILLLRRQVSQKQQPLSLIWR